MLITLILALQAGAGDLSSGTLSGGDGTLFSDDGLGIQTVERIDLRLGDDHRFRLSVTTSEGQQTLLGQWALPPEGSVAVVLTIQESEGHPALGRGLLLLDEPLDNGGTPWNLMLQYHSQDQQRFHALSYTMPYTQP